MEINTDFFKTILKTLQEKLLAALQAAKQARAEVMKRLPSISHTKSWVREKQLLKHDAVFWKEALAKYGAQAKDMIADIRLRFRENTFLKDSQVFFSETYARFVVRREYTKRDLVALFILAAILGAGLKSIATETITIGFNDYTLAPEETLYDLNAVQQKLIDGGGTIAGSASAPAGTCSE